MATMNADEYFLGGFAAMTAVTILFPFHCIAIGGALVVVGLCLRRLS